MNEVNDPDIKNPELTWSSKMIIFFDQVWNSFVFKARYVIVLLTITWFAIACVFASRMGP